MIFFPIFLRSPARGYLGQFASQCEAAAGFNRLHGKVTDRAAAMLLLPLLQYFTGACDLDIQQYQYLILMEHLPWESSTAKILCTMKLYHISTNTASSIITDGAPCHSLLLLLFNTAAFSANKIPTLPLTYGAPCQLSCGSSTIAAASATSNIIVMYFRCNNDSLQLYNSRCRCYVFWFTISTTSMYSSGWPSGQCASVWRWGLSCFAAMCQHRSGFLATTGQNASTLHNHNHRIHSWLYLLTISGS